MSRHMQLLLDYNMNQSSTRRTPARQTSRRPFAEQQNQTIGARVINQQEELYRIIAKIRSLEDDIRSVQGHNRDIEAESKYLARLLQDLETAVSMQEQEIQQLIREIDSESEVKMNLAYYEQQLLSVGQKVDDLHEIIAFKNKHYEQLRAEREHVMLQHLRLKQECNNLQYQQNQLLQSLDQLIQSISQTEFETTQQPENKVDYIVQYCRTLELQIAEIAQLLEIGRKTGAETVAQEKEKRIKCEYNIQLLKQRWKDYQQKKAYFKNCYNQQNVQSVIDDMLHKQHTLRQSVAAQQDKNQALKKETSDALACFDKRIARERKDLEDQLQAQRLQNEIALKKKKRATNELVKIQQSITEMQEEGYIVSQELRQKEGESYKRIGELESENVSLQKQLADLKGQIELLQLELSS